MRKKVSQQQVANYLSMIRDSQPTGLAMAKALIRQGYDEVDINKYLQSNGASQEEVMNIIRELQRK